MKKRILVRDIVDRCYDKESKLLIRSAVKDYQQAELERKLQIVQIANQGNDKTAEIYLSTRHVDGDGDIVTPKGWDLTFYEMNPKGLWSHNPQMLPVYKALWSKTDDMGLRQKIQFADSEFANDIWELFKGGFISTFSAGFRATGAVVRGEREFDKMVSAFRGEWKEYDDGAIGKTSRIITDKILFESSICNLPCNPYAMVIAINDGKIRLCDDTTKELKIEEYKKKFADDGTIQTKTISTAVVDKSTKVDDADRIVKLSPVTIQKPFPNEHAFRINDPDGYEEFRRDNDKFGAGISAIWGIYTEDGEKKVEIQAIRFDSSKFTFEQAKEWIADNDYDAIEEEEASEEGEKQSVKPVIRKVVTVKKAVCVMPVMSINECVKKTLTETIAVKRGNVR